MYESQLGCQDVTPLLLGGGGGGGGGGGEVVGLSPHSTSPFPIPVTSTTDSDLNLVLSGKFVDGYIIFKCSIFATGIYSNFQIWKEIQDCTIRARFVYLITAPSQGWHRQAGTIIMLRDFAKSVCIITLLDSHTM